MKTIVSKFKYVFLFGFFLLAISMQAQDIQVKGVVKGKFEDVLETLEEVNIFLKGTTSGTTTDKKGKFIFPKKLKAGDILVFSYLGYKKKEIKINTNSTYLTVILEEDSNVLLGAPRSNKRYKSKRPKH